MSLSVQSYNNYTPQIYTRPQRPTPINFKANQPPVKEDDKKKKWLTLGLGALALTALTVLLLKGKRAGAVDDITKATGKAANKEGSASNIAKTKEIQEMSDAEIEQLVDDAFAEFRKNQQILRKRFDNIAAKMPAKAGITQRANGITIETSVPSSSGIIKHIVKDKNGTVRQIVRTYDGYKAGENLRSVEQFDRNGEFYYKYLAM